jgi:homocysteine S-methyltransferase
MSKPLLEEPILLLDGGLGTTLEDEHGIKFSSETPLWSSHLLVENVETLKRVQRDFADAGADIILTATYQGSFVGFKNTKVTSQGGIEEDEARRLMLSAVKIARDSFNGRAGLVALSLGAYGATMVPSTEYSGQYGSMTEQELFDFHSKRLSCFVNSPEWEEVDLVAIETLPRLDEVKATKKAVQRSNDKPYWISCVFPNDDERLPDGTGVEELVSIMLQGERPPFAIGINCTKVQKLPDLIRSFEDSAEAHNLALPRLVIYPDGAGSKVYDTTLQRWLGNAEDNSPWEQQVYDIVKEVQGRGKWAGIIVGGCCKTTPKHIKKLKAKLKESK